MLLKSTECLIAFAILHQASASQQSFANPFVSFLINAACDDEAEKYERLFIVQLLGNGGPGIGKELLKQSAANYMTKFDPLGHALPQCEQLQLQYCDKVQTENHDCLLRTAAMKNVLPDPDVPRSCNAKLAEFDMQLGVQAELGYGDRDETLVGLLANFSLQGIVLDGEVFWLNLDNNHELVWDSGMCVDTSRGAVFRDLIAKAMKGPLVPAQYQLHCKKSFYLDNMISNLLGEVCNKGCHIKVF